MKNSFNPSEYNSDDIKKGDKVLVKISPHEYVAIVKSIRIDSKNRKVFAKLSKVDLGLPVNVDIQDCRRIDLLDPSNFSWIN